MTTVKIELQFNRSGVTKNDVYDYFKELMQFNRSSVTKNNVYDYLNELLDFYSISVYEDGKQKEFEWDHKEF